MNKHDAKNILPVVAMIEQLATAMDALGDCIKKKDTYEYRRYVVNAASLQGRLEIGKKYRDKITGFEGVCTGRVTYISGCNQALIAPPAKDGAFVDVQWFDEQRLEGVTGPAIKLDNVAAPGFGPQAPKR